MVIAIAFILFILAIERESIIYSATSLMLWLIIMAQSFYITVPGDADYIDFTINAVCLAFIFINLVWMLIMHFDWRKGLPGG